MVAISTEDAIQWCRRYELGLPDDRLQDGEYRSDPITVDVPGTLSLGLAERVRDALGPWRSCLLWVTDSDIWSSASNLHLFYRLRASYGENRLLTSAPAHVFQSYESADLATFVQIGLISGWEMYIVTDLKYGRVFVSHDSWIEIWRTGENDLTESISSLEKIGCRRRSTAVNRT